MFTTNQTNTFQPVDLPSYDVCISVEGSLVFVTKE